VDVFEQVENTRVRITTDALPGPGALSLSSLEEFLTIVLGEEIKLLDPAVLEMLRTLSLPAGMWPLIASPLHRERVNESVRRSISMALKSDDNVCYLPHWLKVRSFLDSLSPVRVDVNTWREISKSTPAISGARYQIGPSGSLGRSRFTTAGTSTGRLTVTEGPNFLVAPTEVRRAFVPAKQDATVVYVDFTSMEPRTLLATTGQQAPPGDVYADIADVCGIQTRAAAKQATICALYGSSEHALAKTVGGLRQARSAIEKVAQYFKKEEVVSRLSPAVPPRNYFGRPLYGAVNNERLLLNHYTQSTAAELSIRLFADLCEKFPTVRPTLVIHDALVVEVPNDVREEFLSAASSLTFLGQPFPTSFS
jgi:hypothetical protein